MAKIASKTISLEDKSVTIDFVNGEQVTYTLGEYSEEIILQLALHGASQKGGDSYSGESDVDVAVGKAKAVAERLASGTFNAIREGTGSGRITDLAAALAALTGREVSEAVAVIEDMDKDTRKRLRGDPNVKAKMLAISAERAAAVASDSAFDLSAL